MIDLRSRCRGCGADFAQDASGVFCPFGCVTPTQDSPVIDLKLLPEDVAFVTFCRHKNRCVLYAWAGRQVSRDGLTPEAAYRAALEAWEERS